jgi:hypothetical protein
MVRAGVVCHPGEWKFGGYNEIQNPKQRYSLINRQKLTALFGPHNMDQLTAYHRSRVEAVLQEGLNQRDAKWTESIAVGDNEFVRRTKAKLGIKAMGRRIMENSEGHELRDAQNSYNRLFAPEKRTLRQKNTYLWNVS